MKFSCTVQCAVRRFIPAQPVLSVCRHVDRDRERLHYPQLSSIDRLVTRTQNTTTMTGRSPLECAVTGEQIKCTDTVLCYQTSP